MRGTRHDRHKKRRPRHEQRDRHQDHRHRSPRGWYHPGSDPQPVPGHHRGQPAPRWQRELARDGFTPWLIAQKDRPFQEGRSDWIRDLARDVAYDTAWPRGQVRLRELHDYLYDLNGIGEAHAALDQAWAEWRKAAS